MRVDNPLPFFVCLPLLALVSGLLSRKFSVIHQVPRSHLGTLPLDGLRGILASAVFFHHAVISYFYFQTGQWQAPASRFYAQMGPTAVTMFFFISGYLFWGKLLRSPQSIRWKVLWPNRIRRIVPAYSAALLWLGAIVLMKSRFQLVVSHARLAVEMGQWVTFGIPLGFSTINGINAPVATSGVFWTLQQEWLFYLLLPALIWFRKWPRLILLVLLAALASIVLSRAEPLGNSIRSLSDLDRYGSSWDTVIETFRMFGYNLAASFAVGMGVAHLSRESEIFRLSRHRALIFLAAGLCAIQVLYIPALYQWPECVMIAPIFLMVVAGNSFSGILTSRPMRCLGTISYSFYIYQGLLLFTILHGLNHAYAIRNLNALQYWSLIAAIGCILVFLSTLSYVYIERPFFDSVRGPGPVPQRSSGK